MIFVYLKFISAQSRGKHHTPKRSEEIYHRRTTLAFQSPALWTARITSCMIPKQQTIHLRLDTGHTVQMGFQKKTYAVLLQLSETWLQFLDDRNEDVYCLVAWPARRCTVSFPCSLYGVSQSPKTKKRLMAG